MRMTMTDSLETYNVFKEVFDLSDNDAQKVAKVLGAIPNDVATKQDIAEVRTEIAEVKSELKQDIAGVRTEIAEVKYSLTVRMGGMLTAAVAVLGILMKIL